MHDTVTIYRCNSYGRIESEAGCHPSKSGKSWTRVDTFASNSTTRRFNANNGWTESQRTALASAVEYHSKNVESKRRSLEIAKGNLANAVRAYNRFDEQGADHA
jgi:hypothetical protein